MFSSHADAQRNPHAVMMPPRDPAQRRRVVGGALLAAGAAGAAALLAIACSQSTTVSGPAAQLHSITISPANDTLAAGATATFKARPLDASGNPVAGVALAWATSNAAILTVTQQGVATAVAPGTAQLAASAYGVSGLATVIVREAAVASVVVAPAAATLRPGAAVQLSDTTKDAAGHVITGRTVTWASDNDSVVTVDQSGLVTAKSVGTAHVSATIGAASGQPQVSGQSTVTVALVPVAAVSITPNRPTLFVSQTTQLTAAPTDSVGDVLNGRTVTWQSLTPNLATVTASGTLATVTGVAAGTALIQASCEGKLAVDSVTILPTPINAVEISPSTFTIVIAGPPQGIVGQVSNALGQIVPGAPVTFSATNSNALVLQTGAASANVIALLPGTDTIVGTSGPISGIAVAVVQLPLIPSGSIAPKK